MNKQVIFFLIVTAFAALKCSQQSSPESTPVQGIRISSVNPAFWEYNSEPVLLLGGSVEDNLFQVSDLEQHLDLLLYAGGNYVRNTMSSRDSGNVWAFKQLETGMYDLYQWDEEYWRRFSVFLEETAKRNIVVQMEIWATFDFYRDYWDLNPFNPENNINYDSQRSKLSTRIPTHPIFTENNFFRSVPSQMALAPVLRYQQRFVDKILSYSLQHDHVLYCIDNETSVTSDWGIYWARYIRKMAAQAGKEVYITEMWDPWELNHPFHAVTLDHPDIFQFLDISQNNHQTADDHWHNGLSYFEQLGFSGNIRPVNNVKVYGNDGGAHKTTRDATENFVKNILMGCASARFHRPTSGQGLNDRAQSVIRSVRELTDRMDHFNAMPANDMLLDRQAGEAYCRAIAGKELAIYFPDGGEVSVDLGQFQATPTLVWLELLTSSRTDPVELTKTTVSIRTPGDGHWVALIQ